MASPTPNIGFTYPVRGGDVGTWDTPLDLNWDTLDLVLGGTASISAAGTGATLTQTQANNKRIAVTGVLSQAFLMSFPAIGGLWVIANDTTGNFAVTANVTGSATTAISCPQGTRTLVSSNGTDLSLADNSAIARLYTYLGNPNTNVAGTAGASNGSVTDTIWDGTNRQLYVATTSGAAAAAVWAPQVSRLTPQGYLTGTSSTVSPIMTADTTATTIYYTPYVGAWTVLSDGSVIYPYQFSQMALTLTSSQASNQIYDIFMYANPTAGIISPIIGTGTAWSGATAGSCTRGTGGSSTELTRLLGVLVNANQMTLTNGASTYTCPASQGIYLGSIFIDSAAGNVTCHRSYGQSRKWGIFNPYNRVPIFLKAGDSTASWPYTTATIRPSNGSTNNSLTTFMGLPEEIVDIGFIEKNFNAGSSVDTKCGIGINSTTAFTGCVGERATVQSLYMADAGTEMIARYLMLSSSSLGINTVQSLEYSGVGSTTTWLGTETNMLLSALWRA